MEVQWILVCHGLVTLLVLVSFLCGQWPIFDGTPIQRINHFLTFGAYDYFQRFVGFVFGARGTNAIASVEYFCCDRPNPILQFMYLAIVGGTYYLVATSSFSYIPGYYISEIHRYASLWAVGVGVLLFLLASFSDPGTIRADNVSLYLSAYPYDNIIYSEKECPTCKIPKPARSKHCSVCDRCVARFDHHCGWMNNCIGERNTQYFVAFLLWHTLLCIYGTVAIGLILAGQVKEYKVIEILTVYYGVDNSFRSLTPHVVQWLLGDYNTQILLMVFLAIVALLLAGFFGYHAKLCLTNTTTNETYKWQDYVSWQKKLNEARASSAALKASISGISSERKPPESKWRAMFRRSPLEDAEAVVKNNIYDKGFFQNILEKLVRVSTMIYTAIDTFYLTDEQLQNSPSRKDGTDEATETTLRIYGCDLIQESGILLKLPQAVMATGQVLFHRFYCKKSFARFNVKKVAASCVWLASKLEECPKKARQVIIVFHRMESRRENLPIEHLDPFSKKYSDLKMELSRTERHILKEMGFICHVEHPHKFISNYLATLETPPELTQEAWNLANDSLRTTLCVRFKSEVVACGVVYAAARRFQVPLPENPPWWKAFDAEKSGVDEVCRVLAHLYSLPKAKYIPVCKEGDSFTFSNKSWISSQPVTKEVPKNAPEATDDASNSKDPTAVNRESGGSKGVLVKLSVDKLKDSKESGDESKSMAVEGEAREDVNTKSKSERRVESSSDKSKDRERDRDRKRVRDRDRGRDSDRERDREEAERDRNRDRSHRSRDRAKDSGGHSDKSRHHSSRDRDYHSSSYASREKDRDRHRHHSYA
ncbi:hypothetical protein ACFX2H_033303 [Malus domestica]